MPSGFIGTSPSRVRRRASKPVVAPHWSSTVRCAKLSRTETVRQIADNSTAIATVRCFRMFDLEADDVSLFENTEMLVQQGCPNCGASAVKGRAAIFSAASEGAERRPVNRYR